MSSSHPEQTSLAPALVQAWRADVEHDPDRQKAYLRFLQKRPRRARVHPLQIIGWLSLGMLLGMGSLYAATGVPWRLLLTSSNILQRRDAEGRTPANVRNAPASTAAPTSSAPPPPSALEQQPPATATFSEHVEPAPSSAPESWRRAAQALRDRDFETANDALARLSQQGSQAEREAASLVRAQFLLNEQRTVEAREVLVELSRTSSSQLVRGKANQLLASIEKLPTSHRSFELGPGTNQP